MRRHRKACPIEPSRAPVGEMLKYRRSDSEGHLHNDGGESDDAAYFSDAAPLTPSSSMASPGSATGVPPFWTQPHIPPLHYPDATSHLPAAHPPEAMPLHLPPPRHPSIPPSRHTTQPWAQTQHYFGHGFQYPTQVPYPVSALHTTNPEDENPRHDPGTPEGAQAYYYSATGWSSGGL